MQLEFKSFQLIDLIEGNFEIELNAFFKKNFYEMWMLDKKNYRVLIQSKSRQFQIWMDGIYLKKVALIWHSFLMP